MSTREDSWASRLHAAVDEHPGALAFDVSSYVAAGRRRARRRRQAALAATAAMVAVVTTVAAVALNAGDDRALVPATPTVTSTSTRTVAADTNGWVSVGAEGQDVYLVRPGGDSRRVEVAGWEAADEACPTWSPNGTRLLFGRLAESEQGSEVAELVVVPVESDGATGPPRIRRRSHASGSQFGQ